jgi:hypothetical protein
MTNNLSAWCEGDLTPHLEDSFRSGDFGMSMFRLNCSRVRLFEVLQNRPFWVHGGLKNAAHETDTTCLVDAIDADMKNWLASQGVSTTYVKG